MQLVNIDTLSRQCKAGTTARLFWLAIAFNQDEHTDILRHCGRKHNPWENKMTAETISPRQLKSIADSNRVTLIDVRTPIEFQEMHIQSARNLPLDQLSPAEMEKLRAESSPIYVVCRSGGRGKQACERIKAFGIENVVNVEGGTLAWEQAGLPVQRGKKMMSLERQVRIAAGFLVFVGSLLGYFVHPYFIGLSAFVGGGLMFAGITDTCAMGMMIAKMPWNRVRTQQCSTGN
jgi:rhodanese-related sulfurtransferase